MVTPQINQEMVTTNIEKVTTSLENSKINGKDKVPEEVVQTAGTVVAIITRRH